MLSFRAWSTNGDARSTILIFAFLGNLVGAAVFVAGSYYYLYGREPDAQEPGDTPSGRFERAIPATDGSSRADSRPASTQA